MSDSSEEDQKRDLSLAIGSASLVFVGVAISSLAGLFERVAIARFLNPSIYGDVNIALAVMNLSSMIALLGLAQGIPRYISRYDRMSDIRGVWLVGLTMSLSVSVVIIAILGYNTNFLSNQLMDSPDSNALLWLFLLSVPFFVGMRIGVSGIRGFENTIYRTYVRDLLYPIGRIVLLVIFLITGVNILSAGFAYLVICILGFISAHLLLHRLMPLYGNMNFHTRDLVKFSLPLVFSTLLFRLLTKTDTIMLGYFVTSRQVGVYSAAYPIANIVVLVLSSFGFIFLPMASRLDAEGQTQEIDKIYKITTKWILVLTFPLFTTIVSVPGQVLHLLFGSGYTAGSTALTIVTTGFFVRAIGGRNHEALSAVGLTGFILIASGIAFFINIVLNLLLIPVMGIEGAALASGTAFSILNITMVAVLILKEGISPISSALVRTVLVLFTFVMVPVLLVTQVISLEIYSPILVAIVSAALTAISVILAGCLVEEDLVAIEFIESKLGKEVPYIREYI